MSVQFLNRKDRKKSLSGQKSNKNRAKKNILTLPEKFCVKNPELSTKNASALTSILENLLPHAKLLQNSGMENGKDKCVNGSEEAVLSEIRQKRNQLMLGINVVSKGVQNNVAACVIIADDITPKLMTSHLKLLCSSKKVPLVSLPQFRVLTQRTLGFPCIALGIKKSSVDFLPITELISSTKKTENYFADTCSNDSVIEIEISKENDKVVKDENGEKKESFAYLYRDTGSGKRAFVPELHGEGDKSTSNTADFIALDVDPAKSYDAKGSKRARAIKNIPREENLDRRRKRKSKWDSGRGNGTDSHVEYSTAKVMKLGSNPVRKSEKHRK